MADLTETRCLTLTQMLREATEYWRACRQCGDSAGELKWLEAIDFLLDRPDMPRE